MSPVHRRLAADLLAFDLGAEMHTVREELAAGHTRIARTLVKEGPLRLTLVGMAAGGALRSHRTNSPVTIHVLEGQITLDVDGATRAMAAGELAALEAGVPHAVGAPGGAFILLTVAAAPSFS
jgi:quercetin dioxygenase-like cupin family protein